MFEFRKNFAVWDSLFLYTSDIALHCSTLGGQLNKEVLEENVFFKFYHAFCTRKINYSLQAEHLHATRPEDFVFMCNVSWNSRNVEQTVNGTVKLL